MLNDRQFHEQTCFCSQSPEPPPRTADRSAEANLRELRVRNHRLAESMRELEAFCHLMAHDLRTPLQAITCFAQALQESEARGMSAAGRTRLDRIVQGSMRMDAMIGEVLAYAQAERTEPVMRRIDLARLAREVADDLCGAYPRATVTIGPLPGARCDGLLIRQVLANLLGNALKFSDTAERPQVRIDCVESEREIEVRVTDNGAGFDAAYAHKLFGLFQRLHTQREFPGSGVGLAIVRSVVRRHGGSVRAESVPGVATTFAFTLPRAA